MNGATGETGTRDLVVREPRPEELARVAYLFRNTRVRPNARFVAAERTQPLPRFVGAAAWWAEGAVGRFQVACLPVVAQSAVAGVLVQKVLAAARESGLESVQYADLLPEGHAWLEVLKAQGFERVRGERHFEIAGRNAWTRIAQLFMRHQADIPPQWRTEPILGHRLEAIFHLVAPHRLVPPEELQRCWDGRSGDAFDPEMSCILFDGERPFGALLARRPADVLYVDVQVVSEPNRRLRSLADLLLVYHVVRRVQAEGPIRQVQFRCGETEHRQTANLALRMGGHELPRLQVFGKTLNR